MILTTSSVAHYLLDRRLLDREAVVEGDVTIVQAPRRNKNFKVMQKRSPGLFVKQAPSWEVQAVTSVRREAECYWVAHNTPELSSFAALLPSYKSYDAANHILVLELLTGESLATYHQRLSTFPPQIAGELGRAMGTYHRDAAHIGTFISNRTFPKVLPWILTIDQSDVYWAGTLSGGNSQLVQVVKQFPEFSQSLSELRASWRSDALIHGDIKWDNCQLVTLGDGMKIKIVDWELADIGDALWDTGAMLQSYLAHWIMSIPTTEIRSAADLVDRAPYPLERTHAALRAFWSEYVRTREFQSHEAVAALRRSVQYGAARLVQTAFEYLSFSTQLNANTLCLLQASMNILLDPGDAIESLLGLGDI